MQNLPRGARCELQMRISMEMADLRGTRVGFSTLSALSGHPFQTVPLQDQSRRYGVHPLSSCIRDVIAVALSSDRTYGIWSRTVENRFNVAKKKKTTTTKDATVQMECYRQGRAAFAGHGSVPEEKPEVKDASAWTLLKHKA